jgi:hypothetical protein
MIVWKSELTSEMVDEHLSTDELAELAHELDKAIEEICKAWGVE